MKTAMQELTDYMKTYFHLTDESLEMFNKALKKEEEQIREAYILGHYDSSLDIYNPSECYSEIKNQKK